MNNNGAGGNIIVIGSSTGGIRVFNKMFADLPAVNASIVIVQHIPSYHDKIFAERINNLSSMNAVLAEDNMVLEESRVYCAPAGIHLTLDRNCRIRLVNGERVNHCMPSIDVTMKSLVRNAPAKLVGVLLTGMGRDGADGIAHIKSIGGVTIAQDEESSTVYGMPKAAVATGKVDFVLNKDDIAQKLVNIVGRSLGA